MYILKCSDDKYIALDHLEEEEDDQKVIDYLENLNMLTSDSELYYIKETDLYKKYVAYSMDENIVLNVNEITKQKLNLYFCEKTQEFFYAPNHEIANIIMKKYIDD